MLSPVWVVQEESGLIRHTAWSNAHLCDYTTSRGVSEQLWICCYVVAINSSGFGCFKLTGSVIGWLFIVLRHTLGYSLFLCCVLLAFWLIFMLFVFSFYFTQLVLQGSCHLSQLPTFYQSWYLANFSNHSHFLCRIIQIIRFETTIWV